MAIGERERWRCECHHWIWKEWLETNCGIQEGLAQGKVQGVNNGEKESAEAPRRGAPVRDKSWGMPKGHAFQARIIKQFQQDLFKVQGVALIVLCGDTFDFEQ